RRPAPHAIEPPPPSEGGFALLDRQPPDLNDRQTGEDVANTYRNPQGQRSSGYGVGRPRRARERFPHDGSGPERRAVFNLLNMMRFQEAYQRKTGHYGSFKDTLSITVAQANVGQKAGLHFETPLEERGL